MHVRDNVRFTFPHPSVGILVRARKTAKHYKGAQPQCYTSMSHTLHERFARPYIRYMGILVYTGTAPTQLFHVGYTPIT